MPQWKKKKKEFYECLMETFHKFQKYDLVIIMGDFNSKIGTEDCQKKAAGKYTISVMKMGTS